jgi:hypothetical protein
LRELFRGVPKLSILLPEAIDFGTQVIQLVQELHLLYFQALPEFLRAQDSSLQLAPKDKFLGFGFNRES